MQGYQLDPTDVESCRCIASCSGQLHNQDKYSLCILLLHFFYLNTIMIMLMNASEMCVDMDLFLLCSI